MELDSVFSYLDYRKFFARRFAAHGKTRGLRAELARALKTRAPTVSKILQGDLRFPIEDLPVFGQVLQLTDAEQDFLLLLVLYGRADTAGSQAFFRSRIDHTLEERRRAATWIEGQRSIAEKDQGIYYSQWYYCAIHVLTRIPEFQIPRTIAERLQLPLETVARTLDFLTRVGLVELIGERYQATDQRVHQGKDTRWAAVHQHHIKQMTLKAVATPKPGDFNYAFVMSISRADQDRIQKKLAALIAEIEPVVRESKDEELCVLSMDLFRA